MSQILRFLLFVILIAAVSAGVYFYFEENEGVVEKAVEETGETVDELEGKPQEERERRQPENPPRR